MTSTISALDSVGWHPVTSCMEEDSCYGFNHIKVVKWGNPDLVQALLVAGADPSVRDPVLNLTVMHDAAREGFVDSVRVLVDHGVDVNLLDENGNLPLHLAAMKGNRGVFQLLIGLTANPETPNGLGYTAEQLALQYRNMDIVQDFHEYMNSH